VSCDSDKSPLPSVTIAVSTSIPPPSSAACAMPARVSNSFAVRKAVEPMPQPVKLEAVKKEAKLKDMAIIPG